MNSLSLPLTVTQTSHCPIVTSTYPRSQQNVMAPPPLRLISCQDQAKSSQTTNLMEMESPDAPCPSAETTLELHPNVILGIADDDDDSGGGGGERPHMCTICHASYKTRTHLRRHMFIHMSSRPFPCPECGKGFNRKEHLNKHLEAVHGGTKHHCPYCAKEISRLDHLKRHIKNMHESPKADTSGKAAIMKVQLEYGQRQKAQLSFLTPTTPIPPGTIGQTIITPIPITATASSSGKSSQIKKPGSHDLIQEEQSFSTKEPEGDFAPSMTIIPSNVVGFGPGIATLSIQSTPTQKVLVHQRLPSGSSVNLATATNGLAGLAKLSLSLGGHGHAQLNPSSAGEKKMLLQIFNCGECSATFTTEKDLAAHLRTHKSQPYRCPDCPRAYTRREKLTEHIRCVHQGQKFSCEYCNKELSRKDHVLRHIRSVHPEVYAASFAEMEDSHIMLDDQGRLVSTRTSIPISAASKRKRVSASPTVSMPPIGDFGVLLRSVCNVCLKVFGTAYHLTRHIESCHSGDVRPFSCSACHKMFKRKDHLTKHTKSHCPRLKEEANGNLQMHPSFLTAQHVDRSRVTTSDRISVQPTGNDKGGMLSESSMSGNSSDCHHQSIFEKLQVEMGRSEDGGDTPPSPHSMPLLEEHNRRTDLEDNLPHKHTSDSSDQSDFSLAVIDSFMQGNVNVVVVDEEISNFLHQSSNSHLTTTFPCGQCQKEFPARDQLIAHLQEHASEGPMHADQHMSDISFSDF